ncbi:M16 family metallopeptidase [Roseiconus lacunae]|uniref:M16 family metallopeptidase n=1 Tax=Roseiconus lacunae TaxID=2605694 RepID=UPI001F447464|nr:pitrilysin family protein [Roseiconus lacunae]
MTDIQMLSLPCGMTVLVQPMPWLRTAAFTLSLRAGVQDEPADGSGLASLVCEMVQRGAGHYNSRDLVAVQDNLGMDRNSGVATATVSFGGAMPCESIDEAIKLYAEIVRRPHLPGDQLEDARMMMLHELRAIEDEPSQRVMRRLREMHYGNRLGRGNQGTFESLSSLTMQQIQDFYRTQYNATQSILTVAGNVTAEQIFEVAKEAFCDWRTGEPSPMPDPDGTPGYEHLQADSSQTHIAFSFPSLWYGHEDYFRMRAGIGILSDGMSSRLFDRVREKRGLCYTVSASCHSLRNAGGVFGYAGTTPQRAQETLDVTLHEIRHLTDDLQQEELDRWKVRIESALIMEQESSASRASSLASDFIQLGRAMPTEELSQLIESLTLDDVRDYWIQHQPSDYRIVTLGVEPLTVASSA